VPDGYYQTLCEMYEMKMATLRTCLEELEFVGAIQRESGPDSTTIHVKMW
jgi:hypothetical protein